MNLSTQKHSKIKTESIAFLSVRIFDFFAGHEWSDSIWCLKYRQYQAWGKSRDMARPEHLPVRDKNSIWIFPIAILQLQKINPAFFKQFIFCFLWSLSPAFRRLIYCIYVVYLVHLLPCVDYLLLYTVHFLLM